MKKTKTLIAALLIAGVSFGQLNNCINTKEHPLILEIIDSAKTNSNYKSILAFTVINSDRIGLAKSTALNLAYAWASCKKIVNPAAKKDEDALAKAHKSIDLKYLRQLNRMVTRLLHDAVFEPSSKAADTPAQNKLNGILRNSEVSQILRGAVDEDDEEWLEEPWKIPALQIWAKMYHK